MVKYTYKTVAYVLPDAIRKMNNDVRLNRAQGEKEQIQRDINKINNKINSAKNENEKKQFEKQKDDLKNKLSNINNNIFDIKADLYGSMINLNNNNINKLSANINDISSFIKGNKDFTDEIKNKILDILSSQVKVEKIFEGVNLKNILEDILLKVDDTTKSNYANIFNEIKTTIDNIKPGENDENLKKFNEIKEYLEKLVPTDKIKEVAKIHQDKIDEINTIKSELTKLIFGKENKEVSLSDIKEYLEKFNLLNDLYDLTEKVLYNIPLYSAYGKRINKNEYENYDIMKYTVLNDRYKFTVDEFKKLIDNLRKWFSKAYIKFNNMPKNGIVINNMKDKQLLKFEDIKNVKIDDIRDADEKIRLIESYMNEDHMKSFYNKSNNSNQNIIQENSNQNIIQENSNQSVSENLNQKDNSKKSKKPRKPKQIIIQDYEENVPENSNQNIIHENLNQDVSKNNNENEDTPKSQGLDLDEIHNMNIMNSIINSLNDINETLKGIKDLMFRDLSKQSFSERKLGRFKVEKYNPNMSITEFKKLFSKLD